MPFVLQNVGHRSRKYIVEPMRQPKLEEFLGAAADSQSLREPGRLGEP
jgi:hypothetical protein